MQTYVTTNGHVIEYESASAAGRYLAELALMAEDPNVSEDELVAAAYSRDNPILNQTVLPDRGAVTSAVLADPAYTVMSDLLYRKSVARRSSRPPPSR